MPHNIFFSIIRHQFSFMTITHLFNSDMIDISLFRHHPYPITIITPQFVYLITILSQVSLPNEVHLVIALMDRFVGTFEVVARGAIRVVDYLPGYVTLDYGGDPGSFRWILTVFF